MNEKNLLSRLADELAKEIFRKTLDFPYKFQSSIGDQLRRAILSVVLNLVEGGARASAKENLMFTTL